jgi:hypothetical protein
VSEQSGQKRQNGNGPAVDQLSFLDLLFAVPVADLAMRVSSANRAQVSAADWSALAVVLATIVLSWIGLHKDRAAMLDETHGRGPIGEMPFWGPQFVQFLIEMIIIALYFTMGQFVGLPPNGDHAAPAEGWLTGLLLAVFFLYLAWDGLDMWLARHGPWLKPARDGFWVTLAFLVLTGFMFIGTLIADPKTAVRVTVLNAALVILLYVYRVAQDILGNTRPPEVEAT